MNATPPRLPPSGRRARKATTRRITRPGAPFDGYLSPDRPHADAYDEMFAADGTVRGPYRALHESIAALDARDLTAAVAGARPGVGRPGHHVLAVRAGAAVPAGPGAAGDPGRGVGEAGTRHRAAGARAGGVPRRHLRRRQILRDGVLPRRLITSCEHFHREAVGIVPAERRAHPRRRHRPGARRGGHLPGAGGQPAQPVRGVLRDGEPADDGAGVPGPVRPAPGPPGR